MIMRVEKSNITLNYDEYINSCIDSIFVNLMPFKVNRRLRDKEDKEILKQLKRDIFDESIPILRTIRRHFKFSNHVLTDQNIAYKSITCKRVSEMVREKHKKRGEYQCGEVLVCRHGSGFRSTTPSM